MKYVGLVVIMLFSLCAFGADTCGIGPFPFKVSTDKKQHPEPKADANSAVIYILNHGGVMKSTINLAVDGKWAGANRRDDYFTVTVPAGTHVLCSEFHLGRANPLPGKLAITVEAGKVYHVEQFLEDVAWSKTRVRLREVQDVEAAMIMPKLHLSVSELSHGTN